MNEKVSEQEVNEQEVNEQEVNEQEVNEQEVNEQEVNEQEVNEQEVNGREEKNEDVHHKQIIIKPEKKGKKNTRKENGKDSKLVADSKLKGRIIVAACSLLAMILIVVFAFAITFFNYYSQLVVTDEDDYNYTVSISDFGDSLEIPTGEVNLPEFSLFKDKDVANILLIGTDERKEEFDKYARADSIMLLSLNKKTHNVKLVSFERGMLVRIPGMKSDILTHTFHYGGAKLVLQTVRTHFNVDVDKYIRVNFSVFQKLVDEIGGVEVVLTKSEANALKAYNLKEGKNHLDGQQALAFSRLRSIDSDWQRIKRQRKVIAAIKEEINKKSFFEVKKLAEDCLPYVQINLSAGEFIDLLFSLHSYAKGDLDQMTIPAEGTYKGLGCVDFKANSSVLRDFLYE